MMHELLLAPCIMRHPCAGSEVAQYTAAHLPAYVRALEAYKASRLGESLEHAFLGFDATLVEAPVVSKLKSLAGDHNEDEEEEEEDEEGRLESIFSFFCLVVSLLHFRKLSRVLSLHMPLTRGFWTWIN